MTKVRIYCRICMPPAVILCVPWKEALLNTMGFLLSKCIGLDYNCAFNEMCDPIYVDLKENFT